MMRMRLATLCLPSLVLSVAAENALAEQPSSQEPLDIGSRLELFVDKVLVEEIKGEARLQLQRPTPREVVLVADRPWEGNACGHFSVFKDGGRYRMYYRGLQFATGKTLERPHREVVCYAESLDGIHWYRPDLGLVEFDGSRQNNIILDRLPEVGGRVSNFLVFKDQNPDATPDARYKAVSRGKETGALCLEVARRDPLGSAGRSPCRHKGGLRLAQPGLLGSNSARVPRVPSRLPPPTGGPRVSARARVRTAGHPYGDLSGLRSLDRTGLAPLPGSPPEELYTNGIRPYYRASHILLGFPTRYIELGWSDSMRALPELEHRRLRSAVHLRYGTALSEGLFMAGRDRLSFHRWQEAFIRPGLRPVDNWVYGDNYQSWGLVETRNHFGGAPDEISLYAQEGHWRGESLNLRRFTLRVDGFVSASAPMKGGEIITRPLLFKGNRLTLNFSTSAAGSIRVEIQDADGTPLEGYRLEDSPDTFGDELEREFRWKGGPDVGRLAGRPVRLRFMIKDADLYSLRFK